MVTLQEVMSSEIKVQRLEHLGLVAGMCNEIGLVEYINSKLPSCSADKKLSYGQLVQGMVLNGLGYISQPLYMYPEYMKDKPLSRLIGDGVQPEDFNQHSLGRALDQLYKAGVSELYSEFACKVIDHLGLAINSLHLDSTSFHVDGDNYANASKAREAIKIVQGYSRDHRPDLNQVVLNLIVDNQAGIPIYLKVQDGNVNDKSGFADILKEHTSSLKAALNNRYVVGDSAMYTPESIKAINNNESYFVTRVPSTITAAKELIFAQNKAAMIDLGNGYSAKEITTEYAGVKQRWITIFSEKAFAREIKTADKQILNNSEKEMKQFIKLQTQAFACEEDALKSLNSFIKKCKFITIPEFKITPIGRYDNKGRPKKDAVPDSYQYLIEGSCYIKLETREIIRKDKGFFILATSDLAEEFIMGEVLEVYKSQQSVERGFRFLKSPEFFTSSFYLKKPERIEALLMIMTLCLLVYCALQHKIRQKLVEHKVLFKDQLGHDYQNPTARWVFFCFTGICFVTIHGIHSTITQLQNRHLEILSVLGEQYQKIYS